MFPIHISIIRSAQYPFLKSLDFRQILRFKSERVVPPYPFRKPLCGSVSSSMAIHKQTLRIQLHETKRLSMSEPAQQGASIWCPFWFMSLSLLNPKFARTLPSSIVGNRHFPIFPFRLFFLIKPTINKQSQNATIWGFYYTIIPSQE